MATALKTGVCQQSLFPGKWRATFVNMKSEQQGPVQCDVLSVQYNTACGCSPAVGKTFGNFSDVLQVIISACLFDRLS